MYSLKGKQWRYAFLKGDGRLEQIEREEILTKSHKLYVAGEHEGGIDTESFTAEIWAEPGYKGFSGHYGRHFHARGKIEYGGAPQKFHIEYLIVDDLFEVAELLRA